MLAVLLQLNPKMQSKMCHPHPDEIISMKCPLQIICKEMHVAKHVPITDQLVFYIRFPVSIWKPVV